MAGWQIAGGRRYRAVRIARSRTRLAGWPVARPASCPSVPSTCPGPIYVLTNGVHGLLHPHPCEFAILPLHRTSQASCPSPDSTTGNSQRQAAHTLPDSQQTFTPPPLSLISTGRPQRSLSPPQRQTDIPLPTRPPTQPPTLLLDSPRRLPPHNANIHSPNTSGLHRHPLPRAFKTQPRP